MYKASAAKTGTLGTGAALWTLLVGTCLIPAALRALPAATPQETDQTAQKIFDLTNQDRAAHGLPPLRWDPALAIAAAAHADRMKVEKTLSHEYPGEPDLTARAAHAGAHFQALAENIAMGPSAEALEKQWMNSVPHRTNILDPRMNAIGLAVWEKSGYVYAVEDFSNAPEPLSQGQVEQKVEDLLRDQNINPSGPRSIGEQACAMQNGTPAATSETGSVKAVVRFQTPDLSRLPSAIMEQLRSGQFTKAAVGACKSQDVYTSYRVAVVLY
jgi:uncharacterized protein YkwD